MQEILGALVFWVATWATTSHFPFLPDAAKKWVVAEMAPGRQWQEASLDTIWQLWLIDEIPMTVGQHIVHLSGETHAVAVCEVIVTAHSFVGLGKLSTATLRNFENDKTVLRRTETAAPDMPTSATLKTHATGENLNAVTSKAHTTINIRVPRIVGQYMYWPPSGKSVKRLRKLHEEGKPVSFENVEGSNILRAWTQS